MNFELSIDQVEILEAIRDAISRSFLLSSADICEDESNTFSNQRWIDCCATGVLRLPISAEYDGVGEGMLTTALAVRELSLLCPDEGVIFSLCAHLCTCVIPLYLHGTESQKTKYLPSLLDGSSIGGNALTEAEAGSDISRMRTTVLSSSEGYTLTGTKLFVTNGSNAKLLVVYGRHKGGVPYADISALLVDTCATGISVGQVWNKMGLRTSPLAEINFHECEVPSCQLLGAERRGLRVFADSMDWERILMAAYHIGSMERQFKQVVLHCRARRQFGSPILRFQHVSERVTAMKRNIDTAIPLLLQTCQNYDRGIHHASNASMLKLHASTSKLENSLHAVQLFGATGYMKGTPAERQLRDSVASTIYSGTSEIQKRIIIDELGDYE